MEKKWLVFYTKSRHEKKVRDFLLKKGYDVFLPMQKVMRQWSDRKKKVEVPLFNSYIFVFDHESAIPEILQVSGMAWNVRYNGKPAVLQPAEVELIRRFISTGLFVDVVAKPDFTPGDKVKIIDGLLKGTTGILTDDLNRDKFGVVLESIDQVIRVQIDPFLLEKCQ